MLEDLLAASDLEEYFRTVYENIFYLRGVNRLEICLNSEWMNEEDALLSAQDEEISHRIVDLKELARWEASTPISKGEALKAWCNGKEDKLMWCGKSIPQYAYGYCQLASNKTEQFYLGLKRMLEMWDGNLPPEEFRILEQA